MVTGAEVRLSHALTLAIPVFFHRLLHVVGASGEHLDIFGLQPIHGCE